jgi:hypothetical protein
MADIGRTSVIINVPSMPPGEFQEYSTALFDDWESYIANSLALTDYSTELYVEEGSIKAVGRVTAVLGVLYVGIGQYGSFISGLKTIDQQARSVGDYLGHRAAQPFTGANTKVQRRGELLTRLKNLFDRVQRSEISANDAMKEAESFLGSEALTSPEFMRELNESLQSTPNLPEQAEIGYVDEEGEEIQFDEEPKPIRIPAKRREPAPLPPDQYRVEIWRENRRAGRQVKMVRL